MNPHRLRAYLYLLLVALIWGIAGPVIKYTLPDYPPIIFLTYRFFLTILVLIPFIAKKKIHLPKDNKKLFILTLTALLGSTINLGFLFYGYSYTSVLDATLISSTSPLFVVAASSFFLKEKVTKKEKLGLLIAFLGTLLIIIQPIIEDGIFAQKNLFGNILIVFANVSWVFYIILSKYELKKQVTPLLLTTYMFFIGFITLLPFAIFQTRGVGNLITTIVNKPLNAHLGVFYMAFFSGALAYFLYQRGQKTIEASEATLFGYLSPLFAAPLAVFWLKESITSTYLLGGLVIALGVFIAEFKKSGKLKTPR